MILWHLDSLKYIILPCPRLFKFISMCLIGQKHLKFSQGIKKSTKPVCSSWFTITDFMTLGSNKDLHSYPWRQFPPPHPSAVRMCQLSAWLPSPSLLQLSGDFNRSWKALCDPFRWKAEVPLIEHGFVFLTGHSLPSAGAEEINSCLPGSNN